MLGFDELILQPPLKSTSIVLPDGRDVILYELPLAVISDVQDIGQQDEGKVSRVMGNIVRVVSHALLGRAPTDEEMKQVNSLFGASTVMFLYYEALKFSRLGPNALDETKKH